VGDAGKVRRVLGAQQHAARSSPCKEGLTAPASALSRAPTQKNGEKKLRSLLTRTAEWGSSEARETAVRAPRRPQLCYAALFAFALFAFTL
jgi:hypothetical protein